MTLLVTDVLASVYSQLSASAELAAVVGDRIYNHVPQDAVMPYVRFRLAGLNQWDDKGSFGYDGEIYVDSWSERQDDSECTRVHDALMVAFQHAPLTLPSGQNVCLHHQLFDTFVEPDGQAHHGVSRFRMLLSE